MSDHNGIHWTEDDVLLGEYILGRVPDEEKRRLDAHLEICRQCRQAVQTEKEMAAGIRLYGRGQVASRLQQRLKNRSERNRRIVTWQRILSAAAVLVIVAGIGIYKQWFSWGERKDLLTREDFQESKKEPVITEGGS
ncbi:MAG TPA: zf-HC2 domain-containing protein, partial [Bacteroidota bacterium]